MPADALLWLALTPSWTAALAEAAEFPTGGRAAREVLDEASRRGFCERTWSVPEVAIEDGRAIALPAELIYSMPRRQRRTEVEEAVEQRGADEVAAVLAKIGQNLLAADVSGHLRRWAEIASAAAGQGGLEAVLRREVDPLLEQRRFSDARRWVDAGRLIPQLHDGRFAEVVDGVARQIELRHRREEDARRARDYIDRPEHIDAIGQLLGDDNAWALHFVGVAGVGKTSLLRRVASLEPNLGVITARVDFDFLTLDYPLRKPAELLDRFADELRLHDPTGAAAGEFAVFDKQVRALNTSRNAVLAGGDPVTAAWPSTTRRSAAAAIVGEDALSRLVEAFGRAINSLGKRVVLLLDTCEELARLRPDGSAPISVEVTFDLLERLHDTVRDVRVIFCGRRPLASGGHGGWRAPASQHAERDYLRLHEVRGFLEPEAKRYLERAEVPEDLHDAILEQTGRVDERRRFEYAGPDEGPVLGKRRHNPFELALYRRWATDPQSRPTADQIRQGQGLDAYVAVRIVGRLEGTPIADILPIIAILGRFDRQLLATTAKVPSKRFEEVFRWLIGFEWIDAQSGGWYELQRGLRPRVLRYLREHRSQSFARAREQLLGALRPYIAQRRLDELDISHLSAMARVLEDEDEAWEWWRAIEQRFVAGRDWQRASDLTSLLLQERDPESADDPTVDTESDPDGPLAGPFRATYAAAMGHVAPTADAATEWAAVEAWTARHPDAAATPILRLRAVAGHISGLPIGFRADSPAQLERLADRMAELGLGRVDEQLAAAVVSALERIVDSATPAFPALDRCEALLQELLSLRLSSPLAAFARALSARIMVLRRHRDAAWTEFLDAARLEPPRPCGSRWLDWQPPDDIGSRIRLEMVRGGFSPARLLRELPSVDDAPKGTLEGRYLRSAILHLRLHLAWISPSEVEDIVTGSETLKIDEPVRQVHMIVLPLALTLAALRIAAGQVSVGIDACLAVRRRAERDGSWVVMRYADMVLLREQKRLRLRDERVGAASVGRQARMRDEQEVLWALDGLDGAKADSLFAPNRASERPRGAWEWPAWRHARWRGLFTGSEQRARDAVTWAAIALAHERHTGSRDEENVLACALDGIEANQLAEKTGCPPPCRLVFGPEDVARAFALRCVGRSAGALRLLVRSSALAGHRPPVEEEAVLVGEVGVRRAGLIALDEGTMLALRLPRRALPMLEQAVSWLREAGDPLNVFFATVTAAMAAVRSDSSIARDWIAHIESAYRDAQDVEGTGLPAWDHVAAAARSGDLDGIDRPLTWRPWLVRTIALLAWATEARAGALADVTAWVTTHYGGSGAALSSTPEILTDGGETVLVPVPAEFDGWMSARRRLSPQAPVETRVRNLLGRSASLAAGTVTWLILAYLVGSLAARVTHGSWALLVAGFGTLLYAGYLGLRQWLLARSTLVIDIQPSEPLTSATPLYDTYYAVRLSGAGPPFGGGQLPSPASRLREAAVVRVARGVVPTSPPSGLEPILAALRRLTSGLGGRRLDVALVVAPTAAWVPWEALLALNLDPQLESAADLRLRLRRVPLRTRRRPSAGSTRKVLTLAAGLPEADIARVWHAAGAEHDIQRVTESAGRGSGQSWDVLHVAGTFSESAAGVVLQTAGAPLRSSDIALRFPALELCVLQGVAVTQGALASWDRDQASLLRTFAAELADFGIPAVLTLPPMRREPARRALAAVAAAVAPHPELSAGRLKDAMQAARVAVTEAVSGRDGCEAAMQACLYAAGDSRWLYRLLRMIAFEPILASHIPAEAAHDSQGVAGRPAQPRFPALSIRAHTR